VTTYRYNTVTLADPRFQGIVRWDGRESVLVVMLPASRDLDGIAREFASRMNTDYDRHLEDAFTRWADERPMGGDGESSWAYKRTQGHMIREGNEVLKTRQWKGSDYPEDWE
jgi:hypothetical protein